MFTSIKLTSFAFVAVLAIADGISGPVGTGFVGSSAPLWKGSPQLLRGVNRGTCPARPTMKADGSEGNIIEEYRSILKNLDETPTERARGKQSSNNFFKNMASKASKVKTCETDYDCNSGGRNYPLRCVNFVFANFCVDSDDWTGGNGIRDYTTELAPEMIPVRVEDGYIVHPGQPGWPGNRY